MSQKLTNLCADMPSFVTFCDSIVRKLGVMVLLKDSYKTFVSPDDYHRKVVQKLQEFNKTVDQVIAEFCCDKNYHYGDFFILYI